MAVADAVRVEDLAERVRLDTEISFEPASKSLGFDAECSLGRAADAAWVLVIVVPRKADVGWVLLWCNDEAESESEP